MEPTKFKTIITAMIITAGTLLVVLVGSGTTVTANQSLGIGIDFGERNVTWTDLDLHMYGDPEDALERACNANDYALVIETDGTVSGINSIYADENRTWDLWVVERGTTVWKKTVSDNINLLEFTVSTWALCSEDERPTVAVDQAGNSIYGYPQARRTITLSPSLTEMIGSLNAVNTLVGTDKYSNYPSEVVTRQNRGDVAIVGDFLNPSYELIMKASADMVFCDGSQYSHYEMSEKLRKTGVNTIIMYGGESIDTILDNIFIMGVAMRYDLRALEVIGLLESAENVLSLALKNSNTDFVRTMISLSADKAPWVAGSYTYMDDILVSMYGTNIFSSKEGWVHTNSEIIPSSNPSVIIIITENYKATQSEYDALFASIPKEWENTDAYKDGRIFMICEGAAEMAQRAGPRYTQIMELVARILHTGTLPGMEIDKFIGNDYEDYLTYTKDLGFRRN